MMLDKSIVIVFVFVLIAIATEITKRPTRKIALSKSSFSVRPGTFSSRRSFQPNRFRFSMKTKKAPNGTQFRYTKRDLKTTTVNKTGLTFEELLSLESKEHPYPYYDFVRRNKTEIYIRVQLKPKSLRNEVSSMNKKTVTIDTRSLGYGNESNKQLLLYLSELLNVKQEQIEIVQGLLEEHKLLKLTGYKKSRWHILYKIMDTWEALFCPTGYYL